MNTPARCALAALALVTGCATCPDTLAVRIRNLEQRVSKLEAENALINATPNDKCPNPQEDCD